LTPHLEKLKEGDKVHLEGPFGKFRYEPEGNIILSKISITKMANRKYSREFSSWLEAAELLHAIRSSEKSAPCPQRTSSSSCSSLTKLNRILS
jgi:predicted ferric reductase